MTVFDDPEQRQPGVEPEPRMMKRIHPVLFAIITLVITFILYQGVGSILALVLTGGKITDDNVDLVRWLTLGAQFLFLLVPTVILARARWDDLIDAFRFKLPSILQVVVALVAVFSLQQVLQGYLFVQDSIPLPGPVQQVVDQFKELYREMTQKLAGARSPGEFLFVVLVIAITPSIAEELLFRGLVQRSFEEVSSERLAAISTGIIFALFHLNPFTWIPLAILGAYFGFLTYRTGSIILAIIAHFFNNFMASLGIYLNTGEEMLPIAPAAEPTTALILANTGAFGVVFILATYYFLHITRHPPDTKTGDVP
jgi:membrane protease YdiL (CAAX protease family)